MKGGWKAVRGVGIQCSHFTGQHTVMDQGSVKGEGKRTRGCKFGGGVLHVTGPLHHSAQLKTVVQCVKAIFYNIIPNRAKQAHMYAHCLVQQLKKIETIVQHALIYMRVNDRVHAFLYLWLPDLLTQLFSITASFLTSSTS